MIYPYPCNVCDSNIYCCDFSCPCIECQKNCETTKNCPFPKEIKKDD